MKTQVDPLPHIIVQHFTIKRYMSGPFRRIVPEEIIVISSCLLQGNDQRVHVPAHEFRAPGMAVPRFRIAFLGRKLVAVVHPRIDRFLVLHPGDAVLLQKSHRTGHVRLEEHLIGPLALVGDVLQCLGSMIVIMADRLDRNDQYGKTSEKKKGWAFHGRGRDSCQ